MERTDSDVLADMFRTCQACAGEVATHEGRVVCALKKPSCAALDLHAAAMSDTALAQLATLSVLQAHAGEPGLPEVDTAAAVRRRAHVDSRNGEPIHEGTTATPQVTAEPKPVQETAPEPEQAPEQAKPAATDAVAAAPEAKQETEPEVKPEVVKASKPAKK